MTELEKLLLFLLIAPIIYYQIKSLDFCNIFGHEFQNKKEFDVCSRCGLMRRKVRR